MLARQSNTSLQEFSKNSKPLNTHSLISTNYNRSANAQTFASDKMQKLFAKHRDSVNQYYEIYRRFNSLICRNFRRGRIDRSAIYIHPFYPPTNLFSRENKIRSAARAAASPCKLFYERVGCISSLFLFSTEAVVIRFGRPMKAFVNETDILISYLAYRIVRAPRNLSGWPPPRINHIESGNGLAVAENRARPLRCRIYLGYRYLHLIRKFSGPCPPTRL